MEAYLAKIALYNPRPSLNEKKSLMDHMNDIHRDFFLDLLLATENFLY